MSSRYTGGVIFNAPGGWSAQFDGSNYLSLTTNASLGLGTGAYTAECWVYASSAPAYAVFFEVDTSGLQFGFNASAYIAIAQQNVAFTVSSSTTLPLNVWNHVAVTRDGSSVTRIFLNGSQIASATDTTNYATGTTAYINRNTGNANKITGYISSLRVVKGTAVYTSAFTPPTGALQPISGTSLLTCRYPTIVDGSTNAFTITNTGTVTVATSNPFPTSALPNPALGVAGNGIYTLSQYAALKTANLWPAYDPYYKNVTLNLHGNAGAVLPFNTDASTNNFQVTQVGDTRPSNYTPFTGAGYYSNYFSATGSYLSVPYSSDFNLTGDFTIEFWMNPTNLPTSTGSAAQSYCRLFSFGTYNAANSFGLEINSNDSGNIRKLISWYNATSYGLSTNNAVTTNSWQHIALVRSGTTITCYINGTSTGLTITGASAAVNTSQSFYIATLQGYEAVSNAQYAGYLSNFSILKGTAKYTGNFTPTTSPLSTSATNQTLLTCYGNRFYDANTTTTAKTITATGSPSVNPYQPFTAPTGTSAYGSGYFDGSGDYLTTPASASLALTGNWTVEGWVYPTSYAANANALFDCRAGGAGFAIYSSLTGFTASYPPGNGGSGSVGYATNSALVASSTTKLPLNAWSHIAVTRSSNTITCYINGVSEFTYTDSRTFASSTTYVVGGDGTSPTYVMAGYISNLRVVNGTAVYTTAFTPPTSPLTAITNTSLLTVQTNAPSQNNTFLDSSTNNFVITRNGNTTQGTFTPYGSTWSNYFNGSSTYLSFASNAAFAVTTTADYTVEGWINFATVANGGVFQTTSNPTSASGPLWFGYYSSNLTVAQHGSATYNVSYAWTPTAGVWYHVAATRTSGTVRLFINGTLVKTDATTQNGVAFTQSGAAIGLVTTPSYLTGYLSNVRFVNGTSLYTAAFTPSTGSLTAVTNTVVLSCQSNRFIDNSSNNFAITTNGSPSVQRFSPFSPTTAYSTSVIGGSGYFDGSGDYLSAPSSSAYQFGSGDFTIECWVYMTGAAQQFFFAQWNSPNRSWGLLVRNSGTTLSFVYSTTGSNETSIDGTIAAQAGRWAHFAAVRNGNTLTTYMNGVSVASASMSGVTLYSASQAVEIGRNPEATTTWNLNGYATDVRVVKGTAVYTSGFTPPTAPLTAITNTSLLLSYTNAGILDNAMMTDWETLGSAQLNTAYKKYGSGSISMLATGDYCRSTYPSTIGDINGGDFTIEFWVYFTSVAANRALISKYGNTAENAGGLGYVLQFQQSIPSLRFVLGVGGGTDAVYDFSWSPAISTWYHVAVTRSGSSARAFINGSQIGSTTTVSTSDVASPNSTQIGKTHTVSQYLLGYMDDLRITKGVARYTANFTPPTSQVQDQ